MMMGMKTPEKSVSRRDGAIRWKIRFRHGGKETSRTFPDIKDARDFAKWIDRFGIDEALALLDQMQGSDPDDDHTVASWATEHVDGLTGVTAGTVARYRAYIDNDLGRLGELPLTAVTEAAIGKWVKAMEQSGVSGKTIKNKHGFLSGVFGHAVQAKLITSNPCEGTRIPRTISEPMVFLDHDEYARFLGCFDPYWLPLVETLFGTGLRWGEATALCIGDLDLDAATLNVVRAWQYTESVPVLGPPKSKRSRRTIDLAPETVAILRKLIDGRGGGEFVFRNKTGGPVRAQSFHMHVWRPAVALANGEVPTRKASKGRRASRIGPRVAPLSPSLGKRPRIHDARHTCASWLLASGIPINYVQAHLGHESIKTTVDRYGHIMPAKRLAVSNALSAALSASRPELVG